MRTRTRTAPLAGHPNLLRPIRLPFRDTVTDPERPQDTATESVLRVLPDHRTFDPFTCGTFVVDGGDTVTGGAGGGSMTDAVDSGGGDAGTDGVDDGGAISAGGAGAPKSGGMNGSDGGEGAWAEALLTERAHVSAVAISAPRATRVKRFVR